MSSVEQAQRYVYDRPEKAEMAVAIVLVDAIDRLTTAVAALDARLEGIERKLPDPPYPKL